MKPFLILQHRYLDQASDDEYQSVLNITSLNSEQLVRIRMETKSIAGLNPNNYSGIITGGGPSNVSDAEKDKTETQRRFEQELTQLYDVIFKHDIPYLGLCYGMGSIVKYLGGKVGKSLYKDPVGVISVQLNGDQEDYILNGIPDSFSAIAGHKESVEELPDNVVCLATSENCPVQMIRCKENIYATQFHPELDTASFSKRLMMYRSHGYFKESEADSLIKAAQHKQIIHSQKILLNFVNKYKRS